jgi:hypothetical protein
MFHSVICLKPNKVINMIITLWALYNINVTVYILFHLYNIVYRCIYWFVHRENNINWTTLRGPYINHIYL